MNPKMIAAAQRFFKANPNAGSCYVTTDGLSYHRKSAPQMIEYCRRNRRSYATVNKDDMTSGKRKTIKTEKNGTT